MKERVEHFHSFEIKRINSDKKEIDSRKEKANHFVNSSEVERTPNDSKDKDL